MGFAREGNRVQSTQIHVWKMIKFSVVYVLAVLQQNKKNPPSEAFKLSICGLETSHKTAP